MHKPKLCPHCGEPLRQVWREMDNIETCQCLDWDQSRGDFKEEELQINLTDYTAVVYRCGACEEELPWHHQRDLKEREKDANT
jgi:hypothetical protein